MERKHILIISFAYPPLSAIGARRVSKITKLLFEKGWIPHVITAWNTENDFPSEIEIPTELVKHVKWVDIWRIIDRLKIGSFGKLLVRILKRLVYPDIYIPEIRLKKWINAAYEEGVKVIEENKIELIYSSFSPPASIRVAYRLKKKTGIPWINEYRDLWSLNPYNESNKFLQKINKNIEKKLITETDALVTVSEQLRNDLIKLHAKDTYVVYNGYDLLDSSNFYSKGKLIIVYSGALYKDKRNPEPLFKALKILRDENYKFLDKIEVQFYGHRIPELLNELVNKYRLEAVVRLSNQVNHKEIIRIQREASILLMLGWNNSKDAGVVSAKLFEYIGMHKVILGITYPNGAISKILEETGLGKVIVNEYEIAKFIMLRMDDFLKGKDNLGLKFNEIEIAKYSRENQVDNLIEIFEKTIDIYKNKETN